MPILQAQAWPGFMTLMQAEIVTEGAGIGSQIRFWKPWLLNSDT